MPRVFAALIRHGHCRQLPDVPSAHQPFPLSPLGAQQARRAAAAIRAAQDRFDAVPADVIDSSSLLRTWQTAELIRQYLRRGCPTAGRDPGHGPTAGSAQRSPVRTHGAANHDAGLRHGKDSFRHESLQTGKTIQEILRSLGKGLAQGKLSSATKTARSSSDRKGY